MIRLLVSAIPPEKLEAAREIARREHDGFLLFDNRSREFQLLFARVRTPVGDPADEPCCDPPAPE
jgi:hypothetical protein